MEETGVGVGAVDDVSSLPLAAGVMLDCAGWHPDRIKSIAMNKINVFLIFMIVPLRLCDEAIIHYVFSFVKSFFFVNFNKFI